MSLSIKHSLYILLGLLIFSCLPSGVIQADSESTFPIILFTSESKIWQLSSDDMPREVLTIKSDEEEERLLGDVKVSEDGNSVYYVSHSSSRGTLFRYEMSTKESQALFTHDNLSRISPPSPDGRYLLLYLSDMQNPSNTNICVLAVQEQTCRDIPGNADIDFNEFYWINNPIFLTTSMNKISIYGVTVEQELKLIRMTRVTENDNDIVISTMFPDRKKVLLLAYPASEMYQPSFLVFDIATTETTRLPNLEMINHNAVISSIKLSPDEQRVAYSKANTLTITDIATGKTIIEENNVLDFTWMPDQRILLSSADNPSILSSIDTIQNTKTDMGLFSSEIQFIDPPA